MQITPKTNIGKASQCGKTEVTKKGQHTLGRVYI